MVKRDSASVMPLEQFPELMRARVTELVARPKPPPRWLDLGLFQIESRAYYEWYWQRGRHPGREPLPRHVRSLIIERDRGICGLCLSPIGRDDAIHIDHIKPVAHGGDDLPGNLQLAHAECNMAKGDHWTEDGW